LKSADGPAIAVDVGTTTLAASLVDRATGERLAFAGRANPQRVFGADVIARLQAACESEDTLRELSRLINGAVEEMTDELLETAGRRRDELSTIAMAGNPAMEHLVLGLPTASLARLPFRPLFSAGQRVSTTSLGWKRDLEAYLFPLPGGFVGGDLVAFLHGCSDLDSQHSALSTQYSSLITHHSLFLDLGTNGEIALAAGEEILATSAAAGPAFEGGNLSCGMPALRGAIDRVRFDGDRVTVSTIDGAPPAGICGSGVLEAVSGLLKAGLMDRTGRIRSPGEIGSNLGIRVAEIGGANAFVLHRDATRTVYLSQEDVRQVQLAKAAIRAGMEVLFQRAGITPGEIGKVILTGSFGAVLSPEWLKNVGIFSENMVEIAGFVREGALAGVERAIREPDGPAAVDELARQIRVIPLSGNPAFERHFLEQMNFPGD
jgi:uncharacterized 2Fe-2S/4Fe-4S cluster protein (DUF4445 family)